MNTVLQSCFRLARRLKDLHPPHYRIPLQAQQLWRELQETMLHQDEETQGKLLKTSDALLEALVTLYELDVYHEENLDRLKIETQRKVFVFNDVEYPCEKLKCFELMDLLKKLGGSWKSRKEIGKMLYGCDVDEKTVRNIEEDLPEAIRHLIEAKSSHGIRLKL